MIVCSGMTSVQLLLPSDSYSANLTASNLCNQVSNAARLEFTVEAPGECNTLHMCLYGYLSTYVNDSKFIVLEHSHG